MKNFKRMVCMMMVLVLCAALVVPAMAETAAEFVPSVTYKESALVKEAALFAAEDAEDGEDVSQCIAVTNVKQAREKSTDITQEARDTLVEVYEKLEKGEMKLPVEDGYVTRELVDISFMEEGCINLKAHNNADGASKADQLGAEGAFVEFVLKLGVAADAEVAILYYVDGEWVEAEVLEIENNGNVRAKFASLCPVAVCVK